MMENVYNMIVNHISSKSRYEVIMKQQEDKMVHKQSYCK